MRVWFLKTALCVLAVPVWAQDDDLPNAAKLIGDADYGEYLSSECVTCHASQSDNEQIPPLTGWDAETFAIMLWQFREKEREHEAMNIIAARLGDEEIAALAAFFATLEDPTSKGED